MYQTRQSSSTKLPIPRKGTKYVAIASSHRYDSVPAVIAVRNMLKLAKTAKEVRMMVNLKILKINGRVVMDKRESIKLFNTFDAGKQYILTLLQTGKFALEENKNKDLRLCKVVNKTLIAKNKIQLNLHDGTNILTNDKISVGDSVYLDLSNKIKKHISLEKGKEVFILSGKYTGMKGKIEGIEGKKVDVKFKDKEAQLNQYQVILL